MKIFHQYTRRTLWKNPTRTVVTVIGIILSMALFTAVAEGAWSGICFLRDNEIAASGPWHGVVWNCDDPEEIASKEEVKETAVMQAVGFGVLGTQNPKKPYLRVEAIDNNFENLVAVRLTEGRMPENEQEIILPDTLAISGGLRYAPGDTLTVELGRRFGDGEELDSTWGYVESMPEEIRDAVSYTYTVVGIYQRLDYDMDSYADPGYLGLTRGSGVGSKACIFTVRNPARFYRVVEEWGLYNWTGHRNLLAIVGGVANGNISNMIRTLMAILMVLIFVGSVSLIYNSFSISVTERVRQFGILKSVGATKKQIRACVLYEAFLLAVIAIPLGMIIGCVGIGVTLYALQGAFAQIMNTWDNPIRLVLNVPALVLAAAVCLVTTLVSAWTPAKIAVQVSPIEAIRQTKDIRLKGKDVKISRLSAKIFGFSGMMAAKNFKRNRKRCRAVVLSLALSVTLFISAYAFSDGLYATSGIAAGGERADIAYYYIPEESRNNYTPAEMLDILRRAENVEWAGYREDGMVQVRLPESLVTANFLDQTEQDVQVGEDGTFPWYVRMTFLDDDSFRMLCQKTGVDPEPYMNADDLQVLLYNQEVVVTAGANGNRWVKTGLFQNNAAPFTLDAQCYRRIEGYGIASMSEDGTSQIVYYPSADMSEYDQNPDPDKALVLSGDEAIKHWNFRVTALVQADTFLLEQRTTLVFPLCVRQTILQENVDWSNTVFYRINATNHREACTSLRTVLEQNGCNSAHLFDLAESEESDRMMLMVIRVFSFGFIVLMSLISAANIFNTISTNVSLRRREFAMLRSVGMSPKEFSRMMAYECLQYGVRGLALSIPVSLLVSTLIYRSTDAVTAGTLRMPWVALGIAVVSVFLIVGASMVYASRKVQKENVIDALKCENL